MKYHFFELFAALQHIINDEKDEWDRNSIALSNSILRVLSDLKFVYYSFSQWNILFNRYSLWYLTKERKKKKGVVRWELEGSISSGYLAHCSHPFFMSIRIEFSASYSMLSRSFVTPTSLARLFINSEFYQCPLRRSCQLQLFRYLQQTACFCCISL